MNREKQAIKNIIVKNLKKQILCIILMEGMGWLES